MFYSKFYDKTYSNLSSWSWAPDDHESPLGFGFTTKPNVKKAYKEFLSKVYGSSINDIPYVDHIQINGDITTVIWKDGTHTIVTKAADDEFDIQTAIVYAIVKKMTGNTSGSLNRYMDSLSYKIVIKNKKPSTFMETLRTILPYLKTDGKKVKDEEETLFEE